MTRNTIRRLLATSLAIVGTSVVPPGLAGASESRFDPVWPLDGQAAVSSSFCEYRDGHLHSGVDIRTYGVEGVKCFAGESGFVSRARASSNGYGRALYLQLNTGHTLVYAHLAEFAPEVEKAIIEEQIRQGTYAVDVRFSRHRFPVERGEVIGYSGSTGTTDPHLHFEVRDERERPLDPFLNGFALPDNMLPVIEAVEFLPLEPAALGPFHYQASAAGPGHYELCGTVPLSGAMGVSVKTVDFLNDNSGRLAPHELQLEVEGEVISTIVLDGFDFAETSDVDLLYDAGRVRRSKEYYYQLFARTGEKMTNRGFKRGGRLLPADSLRTRRARVIVTDAQGNQADVEFRIADVSYSESSLGLAQTELARACALPPQRERGVYYFENLANVRSLPRDSRDLRRQLELQGVVWSRGGAFSAIDLTGAPVSLALPDSKEPLYLAGIRSGEPRSISFSELSAELVIGAGTARGEAIVNVESYAASPDRSRDRELVPRHRGVIIGPYSLVLAGDMEIRLAVSAIDSTDAIYRLNEQKNEWVYYPSVSTGAVVTTTAMRPGVYSVLSDRYPPRILIPYVSMRKSYGTGAVMPEIVVPIDDGGSGVDDERTRVYLEGELQIARWSGSDKKMFMQVRDPNIIGSRELTVVAFDKIGNRSERTVVVDISPTR